MLISPELKDELHILAFPCTRADAHTHTHTHTHYTSFLVWSSINVAQSTTRIYRIDYLIFREIQVRTLEECLADYISLMPVSLKPGMSQP